MEISPAGTSCETVKKSNGQFSVLQDYLPHGATYTAPGPNGSSPDLSQSKSTLTISQNVLREREALHRRAAVRCPTLKAPLLGPETGCCAKPFSERFSHSRAAGVTGVPGSSPRATRLYLVGWPSL